MLSFNETLVPGGGGGADWLQEHIRTGYLPAWSNPVYPGMNSAAVPNPDPLEGSRLQDAGMRVKALSRWNNYYIAGLRQIMRDYDADGIYLDESANSLCETNPLHNILHLLKRKGILATTPPLCMGWKLYLRSHFNVPAQPQPVACKQVAHCAFMYVGIL